MNGLCEFLAERERLRWERLSDNSPCIDCTNVHRYHRGTSWQEEILDESKCENCIDKLDYERKCMSKLHWYEDNDERLRGAKRKNDDTYDCGVKCPEVLRDGYMVIYPDGWAKR